MRSGVHFEAVPGTELVMQGPAGRGRIGGHERITEVWQAAVAEWPAAVVVEGRRCGLGAAGAVAFGSAASVAKRGPQALPGACLSGRRPVSALYRAPLCRSAARAGLPERRDLPAPVARVDRAWCLAAGAERVGLRARSEGPARLVAGRRRRLDRRREKGGDLVGPSPVNRGFPSSKYHLAVDAHGWPLQVRLGPGNENERAHLLPLVDALTAAGYRPGEVWADRGYCSEPLRDELRARGITPQISKRRRPGDPLAAGQTQRQGSRGRRRVTRTSDPLARHRWVVERTNAWLRRFRRLTIRTEPNSHVYTAYLTIALIQILGRAL